MLSGSMNLFLKLKYYFKKLCAFFFFQGFYIALLRFTYVFFFFMHGVKKVLSFFQSYILQGSALTFLKSVGYSTDYIDSGGVKMVSSVCNDKTFNFDFFKVFFTINRAFFLEYKLMHWLQNRILWPTSRFFEPIITKRVLCLRYNKFPRKHRRERMFKYHLVFLQRYFFFRIHLDFLIFFFLIVMVFYLFLQKSLLFSILVSFCICYNAAFVRCFVSLYKNKFKKLKLGLRLAFYKNFNEKGLLFNAVGVPFHMLAPNCDYQMEVFSLLNVLRFQAQKSMNITQVGVSQVIPKTFWFLVSYLSLWKLLAVGSFIVPKEKILSYLSSEKAQNLQADRLYFDGNAEFQGLVYDSLAESEPNVAKKQIPIYDFLFEDSLKLKRLEIFRTRLSGQRWVHFCVRILFSKTIKCILFYKLHLKFMLNLLENLVNQKEIRIQVFRFEFFIKFGIFSRMCTRFFIGSKLYDCFLYDFFDGRDPLFMKFCGVESSKYLTLIKNEHIIFLIEKYMNDFYVFLDVLAANSICQMSTDAAVRDFYLKKNEKYFVLKEIFLARLNAEKNVVLFDDFKFFNTFLLDEIFFRLGQWQNLDSSEGLRNSRSNLEQELAMYNYLERGLEYNLNVVKAGDNFWLINEIRQLYLKSLFRRKKFERVFLKAGVLGSLKHVDCLELKKHLKSVYGLDIE